MSQLPDDNPGQRGRAGVAQSYRDLAEVLGRYWIAYGGWREIRTSPYFHVAIAVTLLTYDYWWRGAWFQTSISVLPNLLGFSVAGFAIWIGWGDPAFRRLMVEIRSHGTTSAYVHVSATFAHFALVQVLALSAAIVGSATAFDVDPSSLLGRCLELVGLPTEFFKLVSPAGSFLGFFLLVYAIAITLEATLALFRLSTWSERVQMAGNENENEGE